MTPDARPIRTGDRVLHRPTGERWVVAWADPSTDDLHWCGWPPGLARLSDCERVKEASDEEHDAVLSGLRGAVRRRAEAIACREEASPAMTPDARSLLASLMDEEAEAVVGWARIGAAYTEPRPRWADVAEVPLKGPCYGRHPAARSAIAKLRGEET